MMMIEVPRVAQLAQHREQLDDLRRRQHRRRLVEDQHLGVAVERLQDLDALLRADADVGRRAHAGRPRGRSGCERSRTRSLGRRPCRAVRGCCGSSPSTMFSAIVMTGISMKCWCTMPIPRRIASAEVFMRDGAPVDRISPSSGSQQPVQLVHQRALAGPVLAEQRVDLTPPQIEVDVVVRDERAEALRDATELERQIGARARGHHQDLRPGRPRLLAT